RVEASSSPPTGVRPRRMRHPGEKESRAGLVASDKLAPAQGGRRPTAPRRPRPDAEIVDGEVSWRYLQERNRTTRSIAIRTGTPDSRKHSKCPGAVRLRGCQSAVCGTKIRHYPLTVHSPSSSVTRNWPAAIVP